MDLLRLNLADTSHHAASSGNPAQNNPGVNESLLRPVPRDAAVEAIQGRRAFRGLFYGVLIAGAIWAAVAAVISQLR